MLLAFSLSMLDCPTTSGEETEDRSRLRDGDAEVDVREGELVPRDGERARELCLGSLHLLRLDEQLAVVVEHVGGVGEGRLSVGEDTARLGRLLPSKQGPVEAVKIGLWRGDAFVHFQRAPQTVLTRRGE